MLWFETNIYPCRVIVSTVWLVILITPLLISYQILTLTSLYGVISIHYILYICVYYSTVVLLHITQSWMVSVKPVVSKSIIKKLFYILNPSHCLFVILHVAMATIQSICLSQFSSSISWTSHGVIVGLFYSIGYIRRNDSVLFFSLIQQQKFFQIKGCLIQLFRVSIFPSLMDMIISITMFSLMYICTMNITGAMFDLWLPWLLFVNGLMMHMTRRISHKLFEVYQTEGVQFPIVAMFSEESSRTLVAALQSTNPLVKYLGFMDLASLSTHSSMRRSQIYGLSSDGQPIIWTNIYDNCMIHINKLSQSLRGGDGGYHIATPIVQETQRYTSKKGWSDDVTTPTLTRRYVKTERAILSTGTVQELQTTPIRHTPSNDPWSKIHHALQTLAIVPRAINNYLTSKPSIAYLVNEFPEVNVKETFSESILYIWIITALTQLTVYSYTEDQYGVMQRNLSHIIETLLQLSGLLQKYVKQPFNINTTNSNSDDGKYALRNVVEECLQLLANRFHNETRILKLSNDEKWKQLIR